MSDHFDGRRFFNPGAPAAEPFWRVLWWLATRRPRPWPRLAGPPPAGPPPAPAEGEAAFTFVGHSTFLLQLGGVNLLTDPVWSDRASPLPWAGPRRARRPGVALDHLPPVHVVLVSHNHYDHMDLDTLRWLDRRCAPLFVTGLGNRRYLRHRGLRRVAIKVMLPDRCADPRERARFTQEGRAVAALAHENIVGVHAVGESNGIPYLVMEYVYGGSLDGRLTQQGRLPLQEVVRVGLHAASALAAAHEKGLVHRDIKPANLLLESQTGRVKVADFGLAHRLSPGGGQGGEVVGTPHFMSPEQAAGRPADPRSDLFSLGCVLFVCCTGQLSFRGDSAAKVLTKVFEVTPPPVRQLDPDLPEWLEEVIGSLLAKDPALRFPSAAELKWLFVSRWASLFTSPARKTGVCPVVRPAGKNAPLPRQPE